MMEFVLNLSRMTNFRLFQTESGLKKCCRKRKNFLLREISPFYTEFLKDLYFIYLNISLFGKGLKRLEDIIIILNQHFLLLPQYFQKAFS